MLVHHVATASDWAAAQASGTYATSTRGRTLAEEGFVHAARDDQWEAVLERWYADCAEPLVLLTIDTEVLAALGTPTREEEVPGAGPGGSSATFPHLYGPVPPEAVVAVRSLS